MVKWLVIGCLGCGGIAVLGFLALILIGLLGSDDPAPHGTTPSSQAVSSATSEPATSDGGGDEPAEPAAPTDSVPVDVAGASAESDFATLTITSTERTHELQDSLFSYSTSNEYFVVHLDYTNTSTEAQSVWAADFVLVDADGKEYTTNTDVSLAVEDPILIDEVNPDLTLSGTLVFEIPPGTEFVEMRLDESFGTSEGLTVVFD